jgi:hypothetical protein
MDVYYRTDTHAIFRARNLDPVRRLVADLPAEDNSADR